MFLLVFVRELREKSEIDVKPNSENFKKGALLKPDRKKMG